MKIYPFLSFIQKSIRGGSELLLEMRKKMGISGRDKHIKRKNGEKGESSAIWREERFSYIFFKDTENK